MRIWIAASLLLVALTQRAWADDNALITAAESQDAAAAIKLIDNGADVNAKSDNGSTALLWAAHYGDADLVRRLLKAGADPEAQNSFGAAPMSEAAMLGSAPVIELLLKAGVDANSPNPEGQPPLMAVARTGNIEAARILLKHGAKVNAKEDFGGQTALMWAVGQHQPDMVKLLVENGADVNARSAERNWQHRITSEPRKQNLFHGGFTPLLYAAREGCIPCAETLIKAGADVNMEDPQAVSPLNLALINRHYDLAAYLIGQGADINSWDFFGRTPLYNAIDMNTTPKTSRPELPSLDKTTAVDIVKMLLEKGADPNIQLMHRPRYRAPVIQRGTDVILNVGTTPLARAARAGDVDSIKLLLAHGAIVDLPNQNGITPLMAAAGVGFGVRADIGKGTTEEARIDSIKLLLAAGADINRLTVKQGRTPPPGKTTFLWRVRINKGNQRYLFSYVPPDGRTAIFGAARNGWNKVVSFLVANGAKIDLTDSEGKTPVDLAAGRYEPERLVPPASPHTDTIALLKSLCAKQPGCKFPEEEKSASAAPAPSKRPGVAQ